MHVFSFHFEEEEEKGGDLYSHMGVIENILNRTRHHPGSFKK
jgi:hypothetical protein